MIELLGCTTEPRSKSTVEAIAAIEEGSGRERTRSQLIGEKR